MYIFLTCPHHLAKLQLGLHQLENGNYSGISVSIRPNSSAITPRSANKQHCNYIQFVESSKRYNFKRSNSYEQSLPPLKVLLLDGKEYTHYTRVHAGRALTKIDTRS